MLFVALLQLASPRGDVPMRCVSSHPHARCGQAPVLSGVSAHVHDMKHSCSAPRRPWRTMTALQSDRADQQLASRRCHRTPMPCRRVSTAAAAAVGGAVQQESVSGTELQSNEPVQALDWASNQDLDLDDELTHEEQQQTNEQVDLTPQNIKHIDESAPARQSYHRIMMKHAAQGDSIGVDNTIDIMEEAGLEPGPFAYHALLFAHVKAGQPAEGLLVMRDMFISGLRPMAQSYYALMHGFMRAGATAEAHTVFRSYQASGHDAYTGWLAITKQLFAAGQEALARELVETREPQWLPDAELYEHILKSVCASTIDSPFFYTLRTAQSARDLNNGDTYIHEALQVLVEMQSGGSIAMHHMHPILEACAVHGSANAAEQLIKHMMAGGNMHPDGHCMECLAKAHIQSGELREGLKTVVDLLHKAQLPMTRTMRALLLEGSLLEDDLQGALNFFNLRPAGRMATSVPGRVLDDLLFKVSAAGMPAELMQTLMLMKYDFMRLPPVGTDSSGRSFVSLWLTTRHLSAPPSVPAAGFEGALVQPEIKTKDNVTEVDGVRILEGKYAMNAEGKVLSPSSQNMAQLKAELTARSLSTEGKRDDLKRRVMAARSAEPPDMAKEIRKQEAQQDAKRKKQREKEAAAGKGPDAQPGAADQENKSKIKITRYGSGVETVVEEFEAVLEDDEEGIVDDIEDDTAVDPMQPSNAATALDDEADYIVSDGNSAEDLLDDSNDPVADFPAPPVSALAPLVERRPSNEESGAEVALQILALCIDLFGSATAPDYEQMLQAAEAEQNPLVARHLAGAWHTVIESEFDTEAVRHMYTRAAKVCLKGKSVADALNVLQQAQKRGLELDSEVQQEIQHQHNEMLQQQKPTQQQQPTEKDTAAAVATAAPEEAVEVVT